MENERDETLTLKMTDETTEIAQSAVRDIVAAAGGDKKRVSMQLTAAATAMIELSGRFYPVPFTVEVPISIGTITIDVRFTPKTH